MCPSRCQITSGVPQFLIAMYFLAIDPKRIQVPSYRYSLDGDSAHFSHFRRRTQALATAMSLSPNALSPSR